MFLACKAKTLQPGQDKGIVLVKQGVVEGSTHRHKEETLENDIRGWERNMEFWDYVPGEAKAIS